MMYKKKKEPKSIFKKTRLKVKDKVIVITGRDKGKTGEIRMIDRKKGVATVGGVNISKRHEKPRQKGETGKIIDKEMPISVSNIMLLDPKTQKPTRIGYKMEGEKKVRYAKKSGEKLK